MPSVKLNKTESNGVSGDANYKRLEALKKALPIIQKQLDDAGKEIDTRGPAVQTMLKQALSDHTPASDPGSTPVSVVVGPDGFVTLNW